VKIGIFGGSFDPPHTGHLIVAQDAALALGLDRILFIPAARPPHKEAAELASPELRAQMTELAVQGDGRLAVDRRELRRSGPSYTVDTLRELAAEQPDCDLTLLLGVDQYAEFGSWREPDAIRAMARLAVLSRSGTPATAAAAMRGAVPDPSAGGIPPIAELEGGDVEVAVTRVDISSTTIRDRVRRGLPIRYLVPPAVEHFIFERRLYRRNGPVVTG
jgi:nicotinate-nucleotide adenylyltransferase